MLIKPGATGHILSAHGIPAGWQGVRVDNLAKLVGGGTPDTSDQSSWIGGTIPWATPTDITALKGKRITQTAQCITQHGLDSCAALVLPPDTVLYTSRATIGGRALAAVPMSTNQGFANFLPKPGIDAEFLYYYLDLLTPVFIRLGAGTTFLEVSKRDMKKVQCALPPEPEQQAIAEMLDAVDAAIARTRTAIEKAQQLKRGLLQRFFVDGLGRISSADRPGKRIKKGWRLQPTGSLLAGDPKNGISPQASSQPPGVPTFSIGAVREGRINLSSPEHLKYVRLSDALAERFAVRRGDMLIVRGNANPDLVGKCGVIEFHPPGCIYSDILKRVVFRDDDDGVISGYAALAWNYPLVHNQVLKLAKTSNGTLKINSRDVKRIVLPVPPKPEQELLIKLVASADLHIAAVKNKLAALERLKRGLMQDLLTGKVRVPASAASPRRTT